MKTDRVERLLRILSALQSTRGYGVDALAELLSVDRRTVFRDLELLKRCAVDLSYDRSSQSYRLARERGVPPVRLTHAEALALLLSLKQASGNGAVPDVHAIASAGLKLESSLPAAMQDHCGRLVAGVDFKHVPVSDSASVLDALVSLQSALANGNKVAIRYDSLYDGAVIETVVHPYRIAHINRGWYVIGHAEHVGDVRTFKIERVVQMQVLEDRYEIEPGFTLEAHLGKAWMMIPGDREYHVRIRFDASVASNVDEVLWHPTQRTQWEADGSLLFEVDVQGLAEISWWVLGYGDRAQVLDPPDLREVIATRVAAMHEHYHPDATGGGTRAAGESPVRRHNRRS